jgi:hypothetical protein
MLAMPQDRVDCIYVEGSGAYGHLAADDAARMPPSSRWRCRTGS